MSEIKLLDCTVRDGGYLNDWNFGRNVLLETVQRLANAGIEYIELGFIDDRREFDINRSIFPDTKSITKIYSPIKKKNSKLVAMIDYGTVDISHLQPQKDTLIDGIRVIFKKEKMDGAIAYCKEVKKLGYEVFTQLVSTTTYEEENFKHICALANDLMPTALSIVDTYGLMDNIELCKIIDRLDSGLDKKIMLGFHAHNNFQLGYSNALKFLEKHNDRIFLADGTLHGMGKGAGNAPIELLAFNANKYYGKHYDINQILEAVDSNILKLFGKCNWGYSMKFYLAGTNRVHPNYLSDYISAGYLSISEINDILKNIAEPKKLYYDKNESVKVLDEHTDAVIARSKESTKKLNSEFKDRKLLLLGPGSTIVGERSKINNFIKNNNPIIIAVNYCPTKFKPDYIFVTNSRRLCSLLSADIPTDCKIIATSNLSEVSFKFDYVINSLFLMDNSAARDSAIIMALKLVSECLVEEVALAGFDGYKSSFEENFVSISNAYGWKEPYPGFLNSYIRREIKRFSRKVKVEFVTTSMFEDED